MWLRLDGLFGLIAGLVSGNVNQVGSVEHKPSTTARSDVDEADARLTADPDAAAAHYPMRGTALDAFGVALLRW
jgi:hypothetical protein